MTSLKQNNIKYKPLGKTGFLTSICGYGSYRVDYRVKEHADSLELALKSGINLIDTSSNYMDGASEMLIGDVVGEMVSKEDISRDEVIIVSKGGYIQGRNLEKAQAKEKLGESYPEVVKCAPDLWHCIHPEFLADQITSSLDRLKMDHVDVYLLHNPEYFLNYSAIMDNEELRDEYYLRIRKAFEYLETEVEKGRISFYGISSNTFGEDAAKRNFTSLERILSISEEVSSGNHFAVVQAPLNLLEKGGYINKNQANGTKTFLQTANENKLGVLINRPLNAIRKNKIFRLADYPIKEDRNLEEINSLSAQIKVMEDKIKNDYVSGLNLNKESKNLIIESISITDTLNSVFDKFESVGHFLEIKRQYFIPRINFAINEIYINNENEKKIVRVLNNYATNVNILLDSVESYLAMRANQRNIQFHELVSNYIPDGKLSLSQKAILMINSIPEVSCTLVGMRSPKYVKDVVGSIEADYASNAAEFWNK